MQDRSSLAPSRLEDMPPPSVELVVLGVILRAQMQTLSAKKQQQFVKAALDTFEAMHRAGNIVRLRSPKHDAEVLKAQREALAWLRGLTSAGWQLNALNSTAK